MRFLYRNLYLSAGIFLDHSNSASVHLSCNLLLVRFLMFKIFTKCLPVIDIHVYHLSDLSSLHHFLLTQDGTRSLLMPEVDNSAQVKNIIAANVQSRKVKGSLEVAPSKSSLDDDMMMDRDADELGFRRPIHETRQLDAYELSSMCSRESSNALAVSFQGAHSNLPNGRRFACKICSKRFQYLSRLQEHLRTHTGDRPYICKVCRKTFSFSSNLRTHERIHTGERPFVCKICSRSFSDSSNLRSHERTHFNKRVNRFKKTALYVSDLDRYGT